MLIHSPNEVQFLEFRHARSKANSNLAEYRTTPDVDIELDGVGQSQLPELRRFLGDFFAGRLPIKPAVGGVAFTGSGHMRSRQTSGGVISAVPLTTPPKYVSYLGEQSFGLAAGLTDRQTEEHFPNFWKARTEAFKNGTYHLLRYPGGESQEDVAHRYDQHIARMRSDILERGIRVQVTSSHGVTGRVGGIKLTGRDLTDMGKDRTAGNCDVRLISTFIGSNIVIDYGYIYADGKVHIPGLTRYKDPSYDPPNEDGCWVHRLDTPLIPGPSFMAPPSRTKILAYQ